MQRCNKILLSKYLHLNAMRIILLFLQISSILLVSNIFDIYFFRILLNNFWQDFFYDKNYFIQKTVILKKTQRCAFRDVKLMIGENMEALLHRESWSRVKRMKRSEKSPVAMQNQDNGSVSNSSPVTGKQNFPNFNSQILRK